MNDLETSMGTIIQFWAYYYDSVFHHTKNEYITLLILFEMQICLMHKKFTCGNQKFLNILFLFLVQITYK